MIHIIYMWIFPKKFTKINPDNRLISPRLEGTIFNMTKCELKSYVQNEGEIIQEFINKFDPSSSESLLNIYKNLANKNYSIDKFYIIKNWLDSHGAQYYSLKILPEYKWIDCIGKGSFSNAHLIDYNDDKMVLKITKNQNLNQKNYKLFFREMSILKQLNHPYIIKLYNYDIIDDIIFWSLNDYCNLGSLDLLIKRHIMCSNVLRLRFFEQVIEALSYIHEKEIIHRDIKPANIFMTGKNLTDDYINFKIGDFNLSRFLIENDSEDNEYNLTICGTKNYMAPELLTQSEYNNKVDIWGLLCIYIQFSIWYNDKNINGKFLKKQFSENLHRKGNIINMTTNELIHKLNDYNEFEHTLIYKMHHIDPLYRASSCELKHYISNNKPKMSVRRVAVAPRPHSRHRSFTL